MFVGCPYFALKIALVGVKLAHLRPTLRRLDVAFFGL